MKKIVVIAMLVATLAGCNEEQADIVTIKTSYGDIVALLYDETPKHKENFLKLTNEKFYDSTIFHRIVEGFMIQGGDPDSKNAQPGQPLGRGGPGYTVPAEFVPQYFHERGALSAARLGDQMNPQKASSGSQFYIVQGTVVSEIDYTLDVRKMSNALQQMTKDDRYKPLMRELDSLYQSGNYTGYQARIVSLIPKVEEVTGTSLRKDVDPARLKAYTTVGGAPTLDDQYTTFGKVLKGMEVVDKIAAMPVTVDPNSGEPSVPTERVRITVTAKKMSKKDVEKEFGYKFPVKE